jgi:hypothetical protein
MVSRDLVRTPPSDRVSRTATLNRPARLLSERPQIDAKAASDRHAADMRDRLR